MRSSGRDGSEDISEVDTLPLIYPNIHVYMYTQYSTVQ